ncbi:hypothetical protein BC937DRAFT_95072 [Endogone sp. FLAS-F59071]|nr:hypothetical protein BC937DRAFT_95072 [Endogone sp. FLAS-F59071]|eukprot:RUS13603.1 hypothetical protein BC937DRAFT_95072 [Endogone sp. FLAS-F59071]
MQRIASKTRRERALCPSRSSAPWSPSAHFLTAVAIVLCLFPLASLAMNFGDPCNPTDNRYSNWVFEEVCANPLFVCAPNYTCAYRTCSNSDYNPAWVNVSYTLPHRCNANTSYCPDNGYECMPLIANGQICPYARDDSCQGSDGKGLNAICLNFVCGIKGVPLGGWCDVDSATYFFNYKTINDSSQTIERDNCTYATFCNITDPTNKRCVQGYSLGAACTQDRECISNSCNNDGAGGIGFCDNPPDSFKQVPLWTWIVIGVCILLFMVFTLLLLWLLHRFQSNREHEKIRRFYEVQEIFRQQNENQLPETREGSIILGTPVYNQKNASSHSVSTPNQPGTGVRLSMASVNGSRPPEHRASDYGSYVVPGGERPGSFSGETAEEFKASQMGEASGLSPGMSNARVPSSGSFRSSHPLMNEIGVGAVASGSQPMKLGSGNYDGLMMRGGRSSGGGESSSPFGDQ